MTTNQRCDCTEVRTEQFTYDWIIKNFQFLTHQTGKALYSPHFSVGNSDVSWYLEFYPRGDSKNVSGYVSLFLWPKCKDGTNIEITVKYSFAIITKDKILDEREARWTYMEQLGQGYLHFMEREKLIEECKPDDSFTIRCTIKQAMTTVTESSVSPAISSDLQKHQLADDCRRLLKNEDDFSDVTIIVKGKAIPAHKFPLIARSSVFTAMFKRKDLEENRTNEVKIEDIEPEVVEAMLEFIYTDEVADLEDLADRLIAAAHKYDLARLKTMCEVALCKSLDTKDAANILILADLYGSQKFIDHVIDFIANCFRQGLIVENYENVKDSDLLRKVTFAIAGRKQ